MKPLRQLIDGITLALNVIGTAGIFLLMLLINADVLGRSLFDRPISGVPEIVSLSIVAIVFLQIAQTYRKGRLTRSDALISWLARQAPRLAIMLNLLFSVAALGLTAVLFSSSKALFDKAWQRDTYVGTVGDFIAPVWPVKLILLIGCVALMLQLCMRIIDQIDSLRTGQVIDESDKLSGHDTL